MLPLRTAGTSQNRCGESQGGSLAVNLRSRFIAILDSSMVEHAAVNRGVVGSSPTRGGIKIRKRQGLRVFLSVTQSYFLFSIFTVLPV